MVYGVQRVRLLAVLMVFALLFSACSTGSRRSPSGDAGRSLPSRSAAGAETGFETPEEAVIAYLEGLRDADLSKMLRSFAVETYVEQYDFQAYLERLQVYMPYSIGHRAPNANDLITELNVEARRSSLTNFIYGQCLVLSGIDIDLSSSLQFSDDGEINRLVRDLTDALAGIDFDSLEIVGFISPSDLSPIYLKVENQNNMARQAVMYGADRIESSVAVFELGGVRYLICMDVAEYNGRWYNLNFGGNIAQLLSIGAYSYGMGPLYSDDWGDLNFNQLIRPLDS